MTDRQRVRGARSCETRNAPRRFHLLVRGSKERQSGNFTTIAECVQDGAEVKPPRICGVVPETDPRTAAQPMAAAAIRDRDTAVPRQRPFRRSRTDRRAPGGTNARSMHWSVCGLVGGLHKVPDVVRSPAWPGRSWEAPFSASRPAPRRPKAPRNSPL